MSDIETRTLADDCTLVVGAGLAGLFLALKLAPKPVLLVSPAPLGQAAASAWAQGGIAAAMAPDDAPALHAQDTLAAGAGLVDPSVAQLIAHEGPSRVVDLIELGVPFDRSADGALRQSLEAAHSRPRVVRVKGDLAGKAIMQALIAAARASSHIEILENWRARALLHDDGGKVGGALLSAPGGRALALRARETVLAMGGLGGLYRVTTNPITAQGHALAMGRRAGALIADPEFVQFHPTALDLGRDPAPLASEALRGEGARLVDRDGAAFMQKYHANGDLAPRDVVARAIAVEKARNGAFLDARAIGADWPDLFPTVFSALQQSGLDPRTDLLPVAPAAHYHMGGLAVDLWGKTTLDGLSAVGECASTGAHGANRLASNALLESVVFAHRIATRIKAGEPSPWTAGDTPPLTEDLDDMALEGLRRTMEEHFGVVRERASMERGIEKLEWIRTACGPANPVEAALVLAYAALKREESRGAHYRSDFPDPAPKAQRSWIAGPRAKEKAI